ncbi:N5-glutamine methyltransferase family protein [Blattabacterium cuenoti]|uniref:N5-glutamine methyltransferase family protein n=1 Tax=Blattabacterium cuenoti TaxID=1653831 RepID=UPI00163BAB14|nr:HemK family protein methyltransferase [Blattabacterium cuenoti]
MDINQFYHLFCQSLQDIYSEKKEIESLFFFLTTNILKCNKTTLILKLINGKEKINDEIYKQLINKLSELKKNKPIQYVIGKAYFFGRSFIINDNIFIPRPETEELVSWIIQDHREHSENIQIFDIGTGSGCIGITLKKELPKTRHIHAIDSSISSIFIASKNSKIHQEKILIKKIDILQKKTEIPIYKKYKMNIIVSNPPYIRQSEKKLLHPNIFQYEPFQSLFVSDEDPFIFYQAIISWIHENFKTGTVYVYFEINQFLYLEFLIFMKKNGFLNLEIKKDIQGSFRMIRAIFQHQKNKEIKP